VNFIHVCFDPAGALGFGLAFVCFSRRDDRQHRIKERRTACALGGYRRGKTKIPASPDIIQKEFQEIQRRYSPEKTP